MRKTAKKKDNADERAEYRFDYSKARSNRFASRMSGNVVAVVLDPDVAEVFNSSATVNRFLRSIISAVPPRKRQPERKSRRKAS